MSDASPFGEHKYLNYDPEEINTAEDAAELFEWLAEQNRSTDTTAVSVYEDCAGLLRNEVIDTDE